jgi:hypothetical protein
MSSEKLIPKSKAKSVLMTEEGDPRSRELFEKHFRTGTQKAARQ